MKPFIIIASVAFVLVALAFFGQNLIGIGNLVPGELTGTPTSEWIKLSTESYGILHGSVTCPSDVGYCAFAINSNCNSEKRVIATMPANGMESRACLFKDGVNAGDTCIGSFKVLGGFYTVMHNAQVAYDGPNCVYSLYARGYDTSSVTTTTLPQEGTPWYQFILDALNDAWQNIRFYLSQIGINI